MRRSLIITVVATTVMVLVALLVPMAVLLQSYALEDRLTRAALEVQATETVVSGQDKGAVSIYVNNINSGNDSILTTVLYPDGTTIGPRPGEDDRVRESRETGRARVDDVSGGAEILVPVALGGNSALPENTPVVRVSVLERGFADEVRLSWVLLAALGLLLLVGSLVVADRLGRSFVIPMRALAETARRLGNGDLEARVEPHGPPEAREVGTALNRLVGRVDELLERERRAVADLSHRLRTPLTALRLDVDAVDNSPARSRLTGDVDLLERMVDDVVREGRRSQREGLRPNADAVVVLRARAEFWRPLAEDQGRSFELEAPDDSLMVRTSGSDLEAMLDALLDNVFSYTTDGVGVLLRLQTLPDGSGQLTVEDDGSGFPAGVDVTQRGTSRAGSTGLGLDIVRRTAEAAGGQLLVGHSSRGGARVIVTFAAAD